MKDKQIKKTSVGNTLVLQFFIVFTLSVLASRELFHNWLFNRTETKSWIFFLVWICPVIWYQVSQLKLQKPIFINTYALYLSIFITLLGVLGSLNTLCYFGFALIFLALLPPKPVLLIWLLGSVLWMPAIGWVALWYFSSYAFFVRLALTGLVTSLTIFYLKEEKNKGLDHE